MLFLYKAQSSYQVEGHACVLNSMLKKTNTVQIINLCCIMYKNWNDCKNSRWRLILHIKADTSIIPPFFFIRLHFAITIFNTNFRILLITDELTFFIPPLFLELVGLTQTFLMIIQGSVPVRSKTIQIMLSVPVGSLKRLRFTK